MRKHSVCLLFVMVLTLFFPSLLLTGCAGSGGGAGSGKSGQMNLQVSYPQDRRQDSSPDPSATPSSSPIPSPTYLSMYLIDVLNSVNEEKLVNTTSITYPENTAQIDGIPVGPVIVVVAGVDDKMNMVTYGRASAQVTEGGNSPVEVVTTPVHPVPVPTPTLIPSPSPSPSPTEVVSPSPSPSPSPSSSSSPSPVISASPSPSPSPSEGYFLSRTFGGNSDEINANSALRFPASAAFWNDGANNYVYVSDMGKGRFARFDTSGTFAGQQWFAGDFGKSYFKPGDIAVSGSYLYVSFTCGTGGSPSSEIWQIDLSNGNKDLKGSFSIPVLGIGVVSSGLTMYATFDNNGTGLVQKYNASVWSNYKNDFSTGQITAGATVDSSGKLYVAMNEEPAADRIIYDETAILDGSFGGTLLNQPGDLCVNTLNNIIYVADSGNDMLKKFTKSTSWTFNTQLGSHGAGDNQFFSPSSVTFGENDNVLYITDQFNHALKKYDATGPSWSNLTGRLYNVSGYLNGPQSAVVPGNSQYLYVSNSCNSRIELYDKDTGSYFNSFGSWEASPWFFRNPADLAYSDGYLYILDPGKGQITRCQPSPVATAYANTFTPVPASDFDMAPRHIAVSGNNIYVTGNEWNVKKFTVNGSNLENMINLSLGAGTSVGQFKHPMGIAVDSQGKVYVADGDNGRLQVYSGTGWSVKISGLSYPNGLAVDSAGNIYVSDQTGVKKFDGNGNILATIGSSGQFIHPIDVSVDTSGDIYVTDYMRFNVFKFKRI